MDPYQQQCFTYTWDYLDANKRVVSSLHDSLYRMQLHSGYPQEAAHQVPTPEAYESYCAWPGDRPFVHGGGGSSFMQVDEPVVMIRVMQTYMIRTKWQVRIQAKALQVMKSRTREE